METEIQFIGPTNFEDLAGAEPEDFDCDLANAPRRTSPSPAATTTSRDASAPYLTSMLTAELLGPKREAERFRALNFAKYRAALLQKKLTLNASCKRIVDEIERWMRLAGEVRNEIVAANVRLVVSVAKKFAGDRNSLGELISDGNVTLIRAVEKFDYSRGFRFSTYATWALRYNFARTVGKKPSAVARCLGGDELLDEVPDARDDLVAERGLAEGNLALNRMLAKLDPREHAIVLGRFGLQPGCEEKSLQEIAREMGVCKERVRQLQIRALDKLKSMAAEMRFESFEPI